MRVLGYIQVASKIWLKFFLFFFFFSWPVFSNYPKDQKLVAERLSDRFRP